MCDGDGCGARARTTADVQVRMCAGRVAGQDCDDDDGMIAVWVRCVCMCARCGMGARR